MDIIIPLTLEATGLVMQAYPKKFNSTPEEIYDLFYKKLSYIYIYILSDGDYFFAKESDLEDRQYVPVTIEEARERLFILSLAQ